MSEPNIKSLINKVNTFKQLLFNIDIQSKKIIAEEDSWPLKIEKESLRMLTSGAWDATSILVNGKEKINITMKKIYFVIFKI